MKKWIPTLLLLLSILSCGVTKNTDAVIFRHINLNKPYGAFYLGTQKEDIIHLINTENDRFLLKNHVYGIAQSIELEFDSKNKLKKAIFRYPSHWNKNSEIIEYQELLGTPTIKKGKTIWNDGKTQFEIYSINGQSYSEMTDL